MVVGNVFNIENDTEAHVQRALLIVACHAFLFTLFTTPVIEAYRDNRKHGGGGGRPKLSQMSKSSATVDIESIAHVVDMEADASPQRSGVQSTTLAGTFFLTPQVTNTPEHTRMNGR